MTESPDSSRRLSRLTFVAEIHSCARGLPRVRAGQANPPADTLARRVAPRRGNRFHLERRTVRPGI